MSLAARLGETLTATARRREGLLSGDLDERVEGGIAAAVLIAITDRPEPGLILTERQLHLRAHAGQIALPGGRIDPADSSPIDEALREAWEEIALPPRTAEVVGRLACYRTGTGYAIEPVVAVVPPDLPLRPNPAEVAALFEVPLAHVLDRANHVAKTAFWRERQRCYIEIMWQERRIWGATAAMLANLSRRLDPR